MDEFGLSVMQGTELLHGLISIHLELANLNGILALPFS